MCFCLCLCFCNVYAFVCTVCISFCTIYASVCTVCASICTVCASFCTVYGSVCTVCDSACRSAILVVLLCALLCLFVCVCICLEKRKYFDGTLFAYTETRTFERWVINLCCCEISIQIIILVQKVRHEKRSRSVFSAVDINISYKQCEAHLPVFCYAQVLRLVTQAKKHQSRVKVLKLLSPSFSRSPCAFSQLMIYEQHISIIFNKYTLIYTRKHTYIHTYCIQFISSVNTLLYTKRSAFKGT